jgi:hypothetical protein
MDTCEQVAIETASHAQRRQRSIEEKRRIVEETLAAGASVARVFLRIANSCRPKTSNCFHGMQKSNI